jgi:hypothetical protein
VLIDKSDFFLLTGTAGGYAGLPSDIPGGDTYRRSERLVPLLGSYYKLSDQITHLKRSNGSLDPAMTSMVRDWSGMSKAST